ncbi:uncharacterized protein [Amphiura filiformis]|uniref:uncharacterized protein n=1 Tax=Amphiura filiformis TaxID=82378 RepID=UPI003B221AAB
MLQTGITSFHRNIVLLISCLLFLITKVTGDEKCPGTDNVYCNGYDEYCCGATSCCLDDWHYDYGFWNIWYFWFIIFFILMSCCGGCGFYRRRQVVLRQHQASSLAAGPPPGMLNHNHTTYSSTTMHGHTVIAHPMMYPQAPPPQSYFSGPPSYSEVTSKPDMYPKAYQDTNTNGSAVPYPTSDPAHPPPGPGLPYQNGIASPPPPHIDNGIAAPPPPYTPTAPSEAITGVNSNNSSAQAAS